MPQGLRTRAGELPADTTSFVGREAQVGAVKRLLTQTRLVTLTGPGGVGKTRIAIRVAREIRATFDDGVCLVTLSSLRDPELLANTVATALGLPEQQARPQLDVVVDYLTDKRLLLLLDTCEHLVDACAMLADVLMRSAPGLHIVATSRQPLDVPGEVGYPVPPLELNGDAMTLFIDRAAAIVPGFAATPANRPLIATLCRRLDGIPLAIELAVVRLRALPLEELVSRIDNRLRLLSGGMRRALERHQTLRMTIDWSHDLCTAQERLLWARLSVFAGEFGLGAVEVICEGGELTGDDVIDSLIGLVDKSVVLREDREGAAHYRMLDTVREYGAERLAALGEEDALRARHRDHYLERARRFAAEFIGPDQMTWLGWFEREQANLRLALEHCLAAPGQAATGLELAVDTWGFWMSTGRLTEGRYWFGRALAASPEPTADRCRALWLTCWFLDLQGDKGDNGALLREAREIAAANADRANLAWAIKFTAHARGFRGDPSGVVTEYGDAYATVSELGDRPAMIIMGFIKGFFHTMADGDHALGTACCDESLRLIPEGECWARGWAWWVKSLGLWFSGDHAGSVSCWRQAIVVKHRQHDLLGVAHQLEGLAWESARVGEHERTARLQGAAARLWKLAADEARFGIPRLHEEHDRAAEQACAALGEFAYDTAHAEGAALDLDSAVRYALGERQVTPPDPNVWELLSPREREVAALIAEGLTNKEIAERLVVSKRTVDSHVEHILGKVGVTSRVQIADLCR